MAPFVDSHAHLADPAFDADRDAVLSAARGAGAVAIVAIGESIDAANRAEQIAQANTGFVFWTAGVHPHDAASFNSTQDLSAIREHVLRGAVAIGECGLDYHYDHSPRDVQRAVFDAQLSLAADLKKPVVVHTREADDDTAAMIEHAAAAGVCGVLHCFSGPRSLSERALVNGWYVSFSGIVTFKKWADDDLIRAIPDDRLLIETDAPYLAPVPFRGKRNEPGFATRTLARVASARGVSPLDAGRLITRNAAAFFGLAIALPDA